MLSLPDRRLAFVVRVRLDEVNGAAGADLEIRGSVQLLGKPAVRYFRDFETLSKILREMTEQAGA